MITKKNKNKTKQKKKNLTIGQKAGSKQVKKRKTKVASIDIPEAEV